MKLSLVPEDDMATDSNELDSGYVYKDTTDHYVRDNIPSSTNFIIKRIYFPDNIYSDKINQKEFKKILAKYGLSWIKSMAKTYFNSTGDKLMTGMYSNNNQSRKVFCIYEGHNKPMTAITKISGTGGNFLIDLNSFCNSIGCNIDDKSDTYISNVLLTLQEKGEIYIENDVATVGIDEYEKQIQEREDDIRKRIERELKRWLDAYADNLIGRGINIDIATKFRRMDIEKDVRRSMTR